MKATELMIGDWVKFPTSDLCHKVYAVQGKSVKIDKQYWHKAEKLEPIPLTAEILNKNFPKPRGEYWVDGDFPCIGYSIPRHTDGNCPYVEVAIYDPARVLEFEMYLNYVHELQHALRLCGIEKEIEL